MVGEKLGVGLRETTRGRLRRGRMRRRVGQLAIELGRSDVDAVEERAAFEVERERNDADGTGARQLRWKIRGRVGDDGNAHGGVGSGLGSVARRLCFGKKRTSTQRSPTSVISTSSVDITAVV